MTVHKHIKYNIINGKSIATIVIQSEIFDNLEISDFKTYIIEELSKLEMQLLDYQRTFNDLYCQNNSEKEITKNKLQEKINAINESIKHDGLSL